MRSKEIMNPETIRTKGQRDKGIFSRKGRLGDGVKKGDRPSGKWDPKSQSRRRPLLDYRLSGTKRDNYKLLLEDSIPTRTTPAVVKGRPRSFIGIPWSLIGWPRFFKIRFPLNSHIKIQSTRQG